MSEPVTAASDQLGSSPIIPSRLHAIVNTEIQTLSSKVPSNKHLHITQSIHTHTVNYCWSPVLECLISRSDAQCDGVLHLKMKWKSNDWQNAYIQRMHGCTAVSKGETGEETDRQKENRQTGKYLCKEMVNLKLACCPWRLTGEVTGYVFAYYSLTDVPVG